MPCNIIIVFCSAIIILIIITSAFHDVMNSSVTDGCITRLNVHEGFTAHTHIYHFL